MLKNNLSRKGIIITVCGVCAAALIIAAVKLIPRERGNSVTENLSLGGAYETEIFVGQGNGICTHDESYTEPVIPDGKYYPGGDINADYYMEITGDTFCLRWQDGSIASDDGTWGGEREYKVVTLHSADAVMLCSEWTEWTDEQRETEGVLDKYSIVHGVNVTFDNGKAYIMAPAFRAGEGNVIRTDPSKPLSIPDET